MHIYIHIPFCIKKCYYCDFVSYEIDKFNHLKNEYTNALIEEINSFQDKFINHKIKTIYFGGGTPGVIGVNNIIKILQYFKNNFLFDENIEITVETNPAIFSEDDLNKLYKNGINRISIGIQSFNDKILKLIGRIHNVEDAINSIIVAKSVGFKNISIDLILGLPFKIKEESLLNLDIVKNIDIKHISLYQFMLHKNTKIYKMILKKELNTLTDDEMVNEYIKSCNKLKELGFYQYEVSNFAINEQYISKHNNAYWNLNDYFGFGAGAISTFENIRKFNTKNVLKYISNIKTNKYFYIEKLDDKKKKYEKIMLKLRTKFGISSNEIGNKDFEKLINNSLIKKLINENYIKINDNTLYLTTLGFLVSNEIIVKIFDILNL